MTYDIRNFLTLLCMENINIFNKARRDKRDPTENKRNHIGMHNQKDIAESRNVLIENKTISFSQLT